jgi:hypothetical protein
MNEFPLTSIFTSLIWKLMEVKWVSVTARSSVKLWWFGQLNSLQELLKFENWHYASFPHLKVEWWLESQDSVVVIATGCGLDDEGVRVLVPVGSRIFSSPRCPGRLWGSPSLLSNGYWGLFAQGQSGRGVKLTTHFQLVPRSRKCGSIHPICLHGVVLN